MRRSGKDKRERELVDIRPERKSTSRNNPGQAEIIAARREQVAHLVLRHNTERAIVAWLTENGHVNPDTSKPWGAATIHSDCAALEMEWRVSAARLVADRKAELLAEIREVRMEAWSKSDLDSVLKAVKQERELLGLDAPAKHELTGKDGGALSFAALITVARTRDADGDSADASGSA